MALGKAFIEVHADMSAFSREVDEGVTKKLTELEAKTKASGHTAGKGYSDAFNEEIHNGTSRAAKDLDDFSVKAKNSFNRVKNDVEDVAKVVVKGAEDVGKMVESGVADVATGVEEAAQEGVKATESIVQQGAGAISGFLSDVGGAIGGIIGKFGGAALKIGGMIFLYSMLAAAISGLLSGAVFLAGGLALALLPALGLLLASGTLLLPVFSQLSTVFGELGDKGKAWSTDLKNMDPNLRGFAKSIHGIYQEMKPLISKDVLKPLSQGFEAVAKALEPVIKGPFSQFASAFGGFIKNLLLVFASKQSAKDLGNFFLNMRNLLQAISPLMGDFFQKMLDVATSPAVLNFFDLLVTGFAEFLDKFATWLDTNAKNGNLAKFLGWAWQAVEQIYYLFKTFVQDLGKFATPKGFENFKKVISDIKGFLDDITTFFTSTNGDKWTQNMLTDLGSITNSLATIAGWIQTIENQVSTLKGTVQNAKDISEGKYPTGPNAAGVARGLFGIGGGSGSSSSSSSKNTTPAKGTSSGSTGSRAMGGATLPAPAGSSSTNSRSMGKGITANADGAIATYPQLDIWGEAGPEVKIPLTRPQRAMQLTRESGLDKILGMGQSQQIGVHVYLDGKPFYGYVAKAMSGAARAISGGTRPVAVAA